MTAAAFADAPLAACLVLVLAGAAIQTAVGAGMSVVCGPLLLLALGPAPGVSVLLVLNLLVSVVATAFGGLDLRWADVVSASLATLAGCALAAIVPALPDTALKLLTAGILLAVALPRPPAPGTLPSPRSAVTGVVLAGLVTGAFTVWTATPGPITPAALARLGRSGADIRRTMQPVSIVGYGAALAWVGARPLDALGSGALAGLVLATLVGTGGGLVLRKLVAPAQVVLLVRGIAAVSAVLLLGSLLL